MAAPTAEELYAEMFKAKRMRTAAGEREARSAQEMQILKELAEGSETFAASRVVQVGMTKVRFGGSVCSD